ncbi:LysR family transcriptional regulator [Nitrospirillum viridazoti]|uniref:LysR family transcriptional regulator n=1 Tax=Nitrospirillum viridazoti CBAmc TaxID=1441467 RepID=A0A248JSU1_9PROT|nr:LysR family transcriptional regulator [Nitrospirillum amazonense]ASG21596.1 LysR family transcriptional regulator [Nitrospirillum amazonense CBAmc]TWB42259.1 LysR family transcriptional regulator [Nitrospirillum amazonense]
MDRIDAMRVFVAAVDEGSLAGAARRMRRSAAAVSRAIAFLEGHVGTALLHRTTRSLHLSEAGERYAAACRRVLAELDEADMLAAGERSAPRGLLTVTAPVAAGENVLGPILAGFMDAYPEVSVRLNMIDHPVSLIDEGMDLALRISHLADSALVATRVGEVRRVVAASPSYLESHPAIEQPSDLARHAIVAMTHFGLETWSFPPAPGSAVPRTVSFTPRLVVNTIRAAATAAVEGRGVTRLFSYHIAAELAAGSLKVILDRDEHEPVPVHLIAPPGRLSVPKVRAFVDYAVPRLRAHFAQLCPPPLKSL